jgi:hypothetical protein
VTSTTVPPDAVDGRLLEWEEKEEEEEEEEEDRVRRRVR